MFRVPFVRATRYLGVHRLQSHGNQWSHPPLLKAWHSEGVLADIDYPRQIVNERT